MSKRKKIVLVIVITLVSICTCVYVYLIDFFVEYAIGKNSPALNRNGNTTEEVVLDFSFEEKMYMQNLAYEEVSVTSNDGLKLVAYEYLNDSSNLWVITLHGYRAAHGSVLSYADKFYSEGYNVLMPDLRAHGNSEGDYLGMGWLERKDMLKWIDMIIEKDSDAQIILHGISMGAATVMMTSGEKLPDNVKCIIEDCGYTNVDEIFTSELKVRFGLPQFPFVQSGSLLSRIKAGYSWKKASAIEQVKKSTKPILFIHGNADDFIPCDMAYKLYDAATCDKDILIVEGAGHTMSSAVEPKLYWDKVFDFINKYVD